MADRDEEEVGERAKTRVFFFENQMFFWMWREDAERASTDNTYIEPDVPALLLIPTLRLVNGLLASMIDLSAAGILH